MHSNNSSFSSISTSQTVVAIPLSTEQFQTHSGSLDGCISPLLKNNFGSSKSSAHFSGVSNLNTIPDNTLPNMPVILDCYSLSSSGNTELDKKSTMNSDEQKLMHISCSQNVDSNNIYDNLAKTNNLDNGQKKLFHQNKIR